MTMIKVSNLTFSYPNHFENIFNQVNMQLDTDWKLGFIGRNGKGKTTFLKLLMGAYSYQGHISSSVKFDYFPFEIKDRTKYSYEILEDIDSNYEMWRVQRELSLLSQDEEVLYRPFESLSEGEQTKLMLALLFSRDNYFLLIDEPTNHLDGGSRQVIKNYLSQKRGFILISHDRDLLNACIDHVLCINNTKIEIQKGNYDTWKQNKDYEDQYEWEQNEKLKKEIKHLTLAARRTAGWADAVERTKIGMGAGDRGYIGHKSAKMMKRAKNVEKRQNQTIEAKSKLLKNIDEAEVLSLQQLSFGGERLVNIQDLSIHYEEKKVLNQFNLVIEPGDRIAIQGKNGSGKSSLLKVLVGEHKNFRGTVYRAPGIKISYVSQDTQFLKGNVKTYSEERQIEESKLKSMLVKLGFSRIQLDKPMEDFSSGQKKKVLIAASLCEESHLLIWDEPLNYMDVLSRLQIEEMILAHQPTMIFVEHDLAFVENIASKKIQL